MANKSIIVVVLAINVSMKYYLRYFLLSFPVLVLLAIYAPTEYFFSNQYDDSYITYRYAINLAEGHGLVFNVGERTDSASSFLYALALSVSWLFGFKNLELVGGVIGITSLGIICVYVYRLAFYLTLNHAAALFAAVACGLNGFLSGWALSGMETLPWSAAVLIAIYLMVTNANYIFVASAIAIAAFMRFEGIFLVVPYFLLLVKRGGSGREYVWLAGVAISFCVFYIAKHEYYGVWISHAFKMKEISTYYQSAPRALIDDWATFSSIPLALGVYGLIKKSRIPILVYVAISFLSIAFGPKSDWSRYSVHLLPLLYGFSSVGLVRLQSIRLGGNGKIVFIAVAALMFVQSIKGQIFNWRNMTGLAEHQVCRKNIGQYINSNISGDEYIASSDLGAISYVAINHRFVDLIALTSADVLANYEMGKTADDILKNKHVKYIADTVVATDVNRFDTILRQFSGVRDKSNFTIVNDSPELSCSVSKTLGFQLNRIKEKMPDSSV